MKKLIPILLVALLLAVGLALPPAETAGASIEECIVTTAIADTDPVIAGDIVIFTFCMYNCGDVPVEIVDITCDGIPFSISLDPEETYCWEVLYDTQPEDIGLLAVCCDAVIILPTGEAVPGTICGGVEVLPPPPFIEVLVDIKPGSDPNSLNVYSKGLLPVAILGTEDFDAMQVDPETVRLSWDGIISGNPDIPGVPPLRWNWEDVNGDGIMDLSLKYSMRDLMTVTITNEPPGPLMMTLKGNIMEEYDGTPIEGYDMVHIINKLMDQPD